MHIANKLSGGPVCRINGSRTTSGENRPKLINKPINNQLIEQRTNSLINSFYMATSKPRFLTQLLHIYLFTYISKTSLYINPL